MFPTILSKGSQKEKVRKGNLVVLTLRTLRLEVSIYRFADSEKSDEEPTNNRIMFRRFKFSVLRLEGFSSRCASWDWVLGFQSREL